MKTFSYKYISRSDNPEKWMFFLHGYNNTQDEMLHIYEGLLTKVKGLAIVAPVGNYTSSTDEKRKSWWKISGFDIEGKRLKQETPVEEIANIYNQVGKVLLKTANELNEFIDNFQNKYKFTDSQTYIGGFSQGAMLGIWTSLIRKHAIKGCFSCSGLVAANTYLYNKICAKPNVYLLHGKQDKQVLYKCMDYNLKTLENIGVKTEAITFKSLAHEVSQEEVNFMADILCKK